MSARKRNKANLRLITIIFLIFLSILILPAQTIIAADKISFLEAITWGEEHSISLLEAKTDLQTLKRELAAVKVGLNWQIDLNAEQSFNGEEKMPFTELLDDQNLVRLGLHANKTLVSGWQISSQLAMTEVEPFQLKDIEENLIITVGYNKQLYPVIPAKIEKDIYQKGQDIKIARLELRSQQNLKKIDWFSTYLDLDLLQKKTKLAREKYQLAQDNLKISQQRFKLGEIGENQLLTARIAEQQAEIEKKQATNTLVRARAKLLLELNLKETQQLDLPAIAGIRDRVNWQLNENGIDYTNHEKLSNILKENNLQLKKVKIQLARAKKNQRWQEAEGKIKLNTAGKYGYQLKDNETDWKIGVSINYNISDGGQQKIALAATEDIIISYQKKYQQTLQELRLQLSELMANIQFNQLELQTKKLALKKTELERASYQKQLAEGLLTKNEFKQQEITWQNAKLDYLNVLDKLLINKLRLLNLIGLSFNIN